MSAEQVVAGRVNGLGELDLFGREVAFGVVRELIGENEQAVERRAQFVRHVREELGFVFGSERQLLGFFFQRLAGLFDFRVLAFDFRVLLGQQLGFFLQFVVGVLQFFLAALQFFGQRLRLLEQIFRSRIRFDGIQHDADGFHELIEERLVRRAELFERGQFHHRLDLAFEQHRQHDDVGRRRLAQTGSDLNVIRRRIGERMRSFSSAAWPTRPSPRANLLPTILAIPEGIAGQQFEIGLVVLVRDRSASLPSAFP